MGLEKAHELKRTEHSSDPASTGSAHQKRHSLSLVNLRLEMSRSATRFFLTRSLLPTPLATKWRRVRPGIRTTRAFAMAASGFDGGEVFQLSDAPGAGVLKLLKGDITQWSVDGATDAIVRSVPPVAFLFRLLGRSWLLCSLQNGSIGGYYRRPLFYYY
jgi:hypothetical protein